MKKTAIIISIMLLIAGFSCRTDFDLNAKWKDITLVYGILTSSSDNSDSIQLIKINKAYLGEGDALIMAKNQDSTYYHEGTLDVKVEEWRNNILIKEIYLHDTLIPDKEQGLFPTAENRLFCFYTKSGNALNPESIYKLYITNKETNKVISSYTNIVSAIPDADVSEPPPTLDFVNSGQQNVKWKSAAGGRKHDVILRLWYVEINNADADSTSPSRQKFIDWKLGSRTASTTSGNESMDITYTKNFYFQYIAGKVDVNPAVRRRVGKIYEKNHHMDLIIATARNEFTTYMDVNEPSYDIVQEKPVYTNITNGFGIFSSRNINYFNKRFNLSSKDTLKFGGYTKNLNFYFLN